VIPVIAIADEAPESAVIAARKAGIRALVSYGQPENLQQAARTELDTILLKAQLVSLQAALADTDKRCQQLIENSSDAIAYIHEGMHVYTNQPYMDLFGINTREDIYGTPVLDMIKPGARDTFKDFLRSYRDSADADSRFRIDCIRPDGECFASVMELTATTLDDEPCTQVMIRPQTSSRELEEKIDTLSRQDLLTGLFNRQHFMERLGQSIYSSPGGHEQRALIYILIDNFKNIRENTGIAASDTALRNLARVIETNSGARDCVARFGEHAFTILHHAASREKIQALAEKLLHDISAHITEFEGHSITTTGSIGICAINEHSQCAQTVLSRADLACEVARSSGGNRIHTHSTTVDERIGQEQEDEWDEIIRNTIDEQRFYLVYQPIVSLRGDTRERYEVLLRIVDEHGHVILPGQFLSIAEKSGLGGEIDRWVIGTAFQRLAELDREVTDATFFIKLSGSTISDTSLPEWLHGKLRQLRLGSEQVVFEIPEQVANNDLTSARTFITAMQQFRCQVALEHYGCGDQPQLIRHLPVGLLKIDGSLIEGLAASQTNQQKVRSIVELAREHGMQSIAERVDDAADLAMLWQYGVDLIQGNFVQEPDRKLEYNFEGEMV
jgi:diguanylate cyclase (GGDEF)-like protein/PAS domain S-box-containing protein